MIRIYERYQGIEGIRNFLKNLGNQGKGMSIFIMAIATLALLALLTVLVAKFTKKDSTMSRTHKMAIVGIFSALCYVLMFIGFPILPIAPYLKVEVSFVVVLLIAVTIDLKSALVISFITATIDFIVKGSETGIPIDQIAYFAASVTMLLTSYAVLNLKKFNTNKVIKLVVAFTAGVLATTFVMMFLNYVWITPFYFELKGWPMPDNLLKYVVEIYGAFNLIKWGIVAIVCGMAYPAFNRVKEAIAR